MHPRGRFGSLDCQVGFRDALHSLRHDSGIDFVKHREVRALFERRHANFAENLCRGRALRQQCFRQSHAPIGAGNQTDQQDRLDSVIQQVTQSLQRRPAIPGQDLIAQFPVQVFARTTNQVINQRQGDAARR